MSYLQGFQVVVTSEPSSIQSLQNRIAELLEELGYGPRDRFCIRLGLEEALVNAVRHGNQGESSKTVRVGCMIDSERARIEIEDNGAGFQVDSVPSPITTDNLRDAGGRGRGLLLMRSFMDSVDYNDVGNRLVLVRERRFESPDED